MGRTHIEAWNAAQAAGYPVRLVAVADRNEDRRQGIPPAQGNLDLGDTTATRMFDPAQVRGFETAAQLFADEQVDIVSLCTPTPTHVALTLSAMEAGKHVLVEKPVDIDSARIRRLAESAKAHRVHCMPAMCMRFWPGWDWLKDAVESNRYGAVRSATFQRLGSLPTWSKGFYEDFKKSGGALSDLHIHDADFVRHLFGEPDAVESAGDLLHITTFYRYSKGPSHVIAEGAWDQQPGTPFRMRYLVNFERATADYDLSRQDPLLLIEGDASSPVKLESISGYDGEVRHFIDVLENRCPARLNLDDAIAVADLLKREREALRG